MLDINKHKPVLAHIIQDIYADPALASLLGFKGGTACYFFYQLPRFSVDLDFDLLNHTHETVTLRRIEAILKPYGTLKESRPKRFTLFFLLSYQKGAPAIKVEISRRPSISSYEMKDFLGVPALVMTQDDMFANKLLALTERKILAHRDVFDLWFFFKQRWDIDVGIVERRSGIKMRDYLDRCIATVERLEEKAVLAGLGELLDEKMKRWAKTHLKKELLFFLKLKAQDYS